MEIHLPTKFLGATLISFIVFVCLAWECVKPLAYIIVVVSCWLLFVGGIPHPLTVK